MTERARWWWGTAPSEIRGESTKQYSRQTLVFLGGDAREYPGGLLRLDPAREAPHAVVSVDTFRPNVARMVVEGYGVDLINDVGVSDESQHAMFRMVSNLRVPYIYMSRKSTMKEVMLDCAEAVDTLRSMGQKDIILDPGFGFGKTVAENYQIMGELERMQALRLPVLVGISRKSMIWKQLCCTPDEALNGTTVLNTISLQKGASILRVHDVREAMECVKLVAQLNKIK